jgi:hypothetical protein
MELRKGSEPTDSGAALYTIPAKKVMPTLSKVLT